MNFTVLYRALLPSSLGPYANLPDFIASRVAEALEGDIDSAHDAPPTESYRGTGGRTKGKED